MRRLFHRAKFRPLGLVLLLLTPVALAGCLEEAPLATENEPAAHLQESQAGPPVRMEETKTFEFLYAVAVPCVPISLRGCFVGITPETYVPFDLPAWEQKMGNLTVAWTASNPTTEKMSIWVTAEDRIIARGVGTSPLVIDLPMELLDGMREIGVVIDGPPPPALVAKERFTLTLAIERG